MPMHSDDDMVGGAINPHAPDFVPAAVGAAAAAGAAAQDEFLKRPAQVGSINQYILDFSVLFKNIGFCVNEPTFNKNIHKEIKDIISTALVDDPRSAWLNEAKRIISLHYNELNTNDFNNIIFFINKIFVQLCQNIPNLVLNADIINRWMNPFKEKLLSEKSDVSDNIKNLLTDSICRNIGFGELEDSFKSQFSEFADIIKDLGSTSKIYYNRIDELKLDYPYTPTASEDMQFKRDMRPAVPPVQPVQPVQPVPIRPPNINNTNDNNYESHPKLSSKGIDIFRYVGQILRKDIDPNNPGISSMEDIVEKTMYTVFINCLFKKYIDKPEILGNNVENDNDINYVQVSYELTRFFGLHKTTISRPLLCRVLTNKIELADGQLTNVNPDLPANSHIYINIDDITVSDIRLGPPPAPPPLQYMTYFTDISFAKLTAKIIKFYYNKEQSKPQHKIIESIIPFAKVDGMLTQPVDTDKLNKQLYNLQTKDLLLRTLRKHGDYPDEDLSIDDIHNIVTNIDMYTSDENLFKIDKYLQVNPKLIKNLLKRKCNINAIDKFGRYPLHYAISYLGIDTIKTLIKKNARIFSSVLDNGRPSHKSPYEFYITAFENYCKPLEEKMDIEHEDPPRVSHITDDSTLKYVGLWGPILETMKEEYNLHTLDIFKYLLEEFIRNVNRHIIYPGIRIIQPNDIDKFKYSELYDEEKAHNSHLTITKIILDIIRQMKIPSWFESNIKRPTEELNIAECIDQLNQIYQHVLEDDNVSEITQHWIPRLELIGIINWRDAQHPGVRQDQPPNTYEIILSGLYQDVKLLPTNTLYFHNHTMDGAGNGLNNTDYECTFQNLDKNIITVNNLNRIGSDLYDETNNYLYRVTTGSVYQLRDYHDNLLERKKDFYQTDLLKPNISTTITNVRNIQDKILNRIIHSTIITIIDQYIINYDICELFVNYFYGLHHQEINPPPNPPVAVDYSATALRTEIKNEITTPDDPNYLKHHLYQFGNQCIELFFYKNLSLADIDNIDDDNPMMSFKQYEKSIIEAIKSVARNIDSIKVELTDEDDLIKKMNDEILPKYKEIFQIFLSNLRKLFLHYINYIENQYKFLKIAKIFIQKIRNMNT